MSNLLGYESDQVMKEKSCLVAVFFAGDHQVENGVFYPFHKENARVLSGRMTIEELINRMAQRLTAKVKRPWNRVVFLDNRGQEGAGKYDVLRTIKNAPQNG